MVNDLYLYELIFFRLFILYFVMCEIVVIVGEKADDEANTESNENPRGNSEQALEQDGVEGF
ncbi:MAG: hypothetical protein GY858_08745 [Candidatus Omnitrophica bacterium]|nr:hypothetical protein [Candidatus Omnitrophota bacterium]